jgi:hyperosmotically inducible periplasmic protein
MMNITTQRRLIPAFAVASLMLAACGRSEDTTAGNKRVDPAVAAADKRADELRADAGKAAQDARAGAGTMANRAGEQISDATITASVNAALAADSKLSAMKIDVDTEKGVVTLSGPAPDETSRARATELAASAKGVTRVENHLTVKQ